MTALTILKPELKDCIEDSLDFIHSLDNLTPEQEQKFKQYQKSLFRLIINATLRLGRLGG